MGLIDELVPSPLNLRWAARKAIERKRKAKPAGGWRALTRMWPARGLLASKFRSETAKKVREEHYPSPFRLIDLFETHAGNLDGMKVAETRAFAPLMVGDTSKNLRRVFKLSEMMKAQAPKDLAFKPLRVHVIGAGVMGADIAGWCVASGMEVSLQDVSAEQIAKGIAAQKKLFARKFRTKPLRDAALARLIPDPKGEHIPTLTQRLLEGDRIAIPELELEVALKDGWVRANVDVGNEDLEVVAGEHGGTPVAP